MVNRADHDLKWRSGMVDGSADKVRGHEGVPIHWGLEGYIDGLSFDLSACAVR